MTGLHSLSAEQYHQDDVGADRPTLSASIANLLITASPAHAKAAHPKLNPRFERKAEDRFDLGNTVHALLLQGLEIAEVMDYPDWKTKAAREARDLARAHGRIPMLGGQWEEVQTMVNAVAEQLEHHGVTPIPFTAGKPEQTLVWEEGDVLCRARLDWLHDDFSFIDDLKSTSRTASPYTWCRSTLWSIGADVQAAMYVRAVRAVTGRTPEFRFVVAETTAPYAISVVGLPPAGFALGNAKLDSALELWKRCLAQDDWPAYPKGVLYADVPAWEESRWLEREALEAA